MNKPTDEILLGIDYGETNTGLAFGRVGLASPLKTVSGKNMMTALNEIAREVIENKVSKIILGLPLTYDDKETNQSKKIRNFAKLLKSFVKKPVIFVNEYNTSNESGEEAVVNGISQKARRKTDHYSAALILKKYYEENESRR